MFFSKPLRTYISLRTREDKDTQFYSEELGTITINVKDAAICGEDHLFNHRKNHDRCPSCGTENFVTLSVGLGIFPLTATDAELTALRERRRVFLNKRRKRSVKSKVVSFPRLLCQSQSA